MLGRVPLSLLTFAIACAPPQAEVVGARTRAGDDGRVIVVASLDPGELRAAVAAAGPRTVRFGVGGVIDLAGEKLVIAEPHLTLDGATAPAPGITLVRGGISVRTHDVRLAHLRVRPGDDPGEREGKWEPDGIGLWGPDVRDVVVEHCSIAWAVDENLAVSSSDPPHDAPRGITIRDCLVAEALDAATHSEGRHSRGALIRGRGVRVERCLFASNARRNPVFRDGATGLVLDNLVYNPRSAAIHLDDARVAVVGNVLLHGPDTKSELGVLAGRGEVFAEDNVTFDRRGREVRAKLGRLTELEASPFPLPPRSERLTSRRVVEHVLAHAGARPTERDAVDQRIVSAVEQRTGAIPDRPPDR